MKCRPIWRGITVVALLATLPGMPVVAAQGSGADRQEDWR